MGDEDPEPVGGAAPSLEARLGWLGIAFSALYLASVYLKWPIFRRGVTVGDVLDVLTPVVLIFLYTLAGRALLTVPPEDRPASSRVAPPSVRLLLGFGAFALVLGHGIHVGANSIHDALDRARISDPDGLANWWDERVSHYFIDSAKLALCVGLTALERRARAIPQRRTRGRSSSLLFGAGAVAYGFIYFAAAVEGGTYPLLLPFCAGYLLWALLRGHANRRGAGAPSGSAVQRFFAAGAAVSLVFFAAWGVWHRGLPEFSASGLIPAPDRHP